MSIMRPKTAVPLRSHNMDMCDVIRCGYFKHVSSLIEAGMEIDQEDNEGKTPLILCAFIEPEEWGVGLARVLIENGAEVSAQDRFGMNVFHYVCIYGRFQLAKVLLNAIDFNLNQVDRYGNTALHYSVKSGDSQITKLIIQCLKRYNLSQETTNKRGLTALELAYKLGQYSCVKLLEDDDTFEIPCEDTNLILGFESNQKYKKCYRECCRSAPVFGRRTRPPTRATTHVKAYKKDPGKIIHLASSKDYRNTKENIFKLTSIPTSEFDISRSSSPTGTRPKTVLLARRQSEKEEESRLSSWRNELRTLFMSYEYQCSPSWRRPVKPLAIKIELQPYDEDEIEKCKEKRGNRRLSTASRLGLNLDSLNQRRRSSFSPKTNRKGSSSSSDKKSPMADNVSIASSCESVASASPRSKKENGPKSPKLLSVD